MECQDTNMVGPEDTVMSGIDHDEKQTKIFKMLSKWNKDEIDKKCKGKKQKSWVLTTEAATRGVLWKKLFLKIPQISQENTCVGVSFY